MYRTRDPEAANKSHRIRAPLLTAAREKSGDQNSFYFIYRASAVRGRAGFGGRPAETAAEANATETPKRGGTLTYMISADAPPSFDGHREQTFATVQATAPFYSVLVRVDPQNPSRTI